MSQTAPWQRSKVSAQDWFHCTYLIVTLVVFVLAATAVIPIFWTGLFIAATTFEMVVQLIRDENFHYLTCFVLAILCAAVALGAVWSCFSPIPHQEKLVWVATILTTAWRSIFFHIETLCRGN